ncbi:MAG TPA: TPM domain-containing protein [Arachidicoccus soli]|nr:TPM domain-containing protein [Arachidicoccus soli]
MNLSQPKYKRIYLVFLTLLLFSNNFLRAQTVLPKPNPPRLVVDNAGLLIPEQRAILEQKLDALSDSTSNQIAVVTIPTLQEGDAIYSIEDYANKLFRSWGIGGEKHNNGVLLLIVNSSSSTNPHGQIKIEVGYGLEGAITDVQSKSIIENDLSPNFKQGNYYQGIDQAINSLSAAAVGEYKVPQRQKGDGGSGLGTFIIIVIIIIVIIARSSGGGGGGVASRKGWGGMFWPMFFGGMLGGGGNNGGGFGGGGFGGGGFGGFGGGSSGGGGASGGW